jgi:hypothetical protein
MDDSFPVCCPYCGAEVEIYLEADIGSGFVQDCEVCCSPWLVRVFGEGRNRRLEVTRADGSE